MSSAYHYIIRCRISNPLVLFSSATFDLNGTNIQLVINEEDLGDFLINSTTSSHDIITLDANQVTEWIGLDGSLVNPGLAMLNTDLVEGQYNDTQQDFFTEEQRFGECLLDILAKALFNQTGARAAIANESAIRNLSVKHDPQGQNISLSSRLVSQINTAFQNNKQSIYDAYVQQYPDRHAEGSPFNFSGVVFRLFLQLTNESKAVTTNDLIPNENDIAELPSDLEVASHLARLVRIDLHIM